MASNSVIKSYMKKENQLHTQYTTIASSQRQSITKTVITTPPKLPSQEYNAEEIKANITSVGHISDKYIKYHKIPEPQKSKRVSFNNVSFMIKYNMTKLVKR